MHNMQDLHRLHSETVHVAVSSSQLLVQRVLLYLHESLHVCNLCVTGSWTAVCSSSH